MDWNWGLLEIDQHISENFVNLETDEAQNCSWDPTSILPDQLLGNNGVHVPTDTDGDAALHLFGNWIEDAQPVNATLPENICHGGSSFNEVHQSDADGMEGINELFNDDTDAQGFGARPDDAVPVSSLASHVSPTQSSELPRDSDREIEVGIKAGYVKDVIERSASTKLEGASSKLKVYEVILVILLNAVYGDKSKDLGRILAFCDKNGREVSGESDHFKTLDTETMALLWQKIKGNRTGSYDTFCRAMRVRREKPSTGSSESGGYFECLKDGLRCKRVYRFGRKSIEDMPRMKRALRLHAMTGAYEHQH